MTGIICKRDTQDIKEMLSSNKAYITGIHDTTLWATLNRKLPDKTVIPYTEYLHFSFLSQQAVQHVSTSVFPRQNSLLQFPSEL